MTIAIIRTDRLGDMILTLPMIGAIRSFMPDARIIVCCRRYLAPIVEATDGIDRIVYTDDAPNALRAALRDERVNVTFHPRPHLHEVWDAVRAGVQRRIGTAYRWYAPLFTTRVRDHRSDARYHEAEYNVRMVEAAFHRTALPVTLPSLRVDDTGALPTIPARYVVIHPGSGGSARDWPAERFAALAAMLAHETPWTPVITGIDAERALCASVAAAAPTAIDLCGRLDLATTMHVLRSADAVVANSTGIIHIAAALGTPVVGLYPTTPAMSAQRWGPYTSRSIVLESGVGDDMSTISVSDVVRAIHRVLDQHPEAYPRP